jgi:CheY-like chemotaxis protein
VRLLLVAAGDEGPAWPAALERTGAAVRAAAADDPGGVAAALRDPLDLILVWEDDAGTRGRDVFAALLREGLEVPVAVVGGPKTGDVPLAAAMLPREKPGWLPGVVARVLGRARLETSLALTGRIAHDLNNLLAPIPLAVQLLQRGHRRAERGGRGTPAGAGQVEAIDAASRGSMAAVRELSQLLVASTDGPLQARAKHLLAITARHWRRALEGRSGAPVGILSDYRPDLASVRVDVLRLLQVLSCLARRALDGAPGGELLFQGRNAGDRESLGGPAVELRVAGATSGVEALLGGAEVEAVVGAGEGLDAVLEVVEAQGGELGLLPSGPDHRGFAVLLPAISGGSRGGRAPAPDARRGAAPASPPRETRQGERGATAAGGAEAGDGRTVLVIDGDEEYLRMTRETLEGYGYRVLAAADGTEGVAVYAAKGDGVAAVVIDYSLPYMDGPTTIRALRRIAPKVPLILTTGAEWEARRTEHGEEGPDAVLRKPFDAETLLETLRRALGAA